MIHTMPDDTFDIMKIHVRAPFRLVRVAAPYFRVKSDEPENRSVINKDCFTSVACNRLRSASTTVCVFTAYCSSTLQLSTHRNARRAIINVQISHHKF
ncbi:hypothetical protein K503DRAFT_311993 [Rhizopogon vinicolor AM-OR11-026]|uniref:Uncharacterized protein n=1 Tax=Rhizopogon vinicolor AM-OR11-026 TaxID=1314800 RepID=A0A1B7MUR1_9AGAM|nr:hypothetical protein K503DRAFT_311993 [Rhizopogon vinicolor AM-OR11-026]